MGNFFDNVFTNKEDQKWCEVLNWLLSEERFDDKIWNPDDKGTPKQEFIKKIKNMEQFSKNFNHYSIMKYINIFFQTQRAKEKYVLFLQKYMPMVRHMVLLKAL